MTQPATQTTAAEPIKCKMAFYISYEADTPEEVGERAGEIMRSLVGLGYINTTESVTVSLNDKLYSLDASGVATPLPENTLVKIPMGGDDFTHICGDAANG